MSDPVKKFPPLGIIKVPGTKLEVEVQPDEVCATAEEFLAVPKTHYDKDPSIYFPGTKGGYYCKYCGQECILAPSGQSLQAKYDMKVTCIDCMTKHLEARNGKGDS